MASPILASLDLGTNTFRLLIAAAAPDNPGGIRVLHHERVITRAGGGYSPENGIGAAACERIVDTLRGFAGTMDRFGVSRYRATATSVFRKATNRQTILADIERETGLRVDVIDGDEEARLSAFGAMAGLSVEGPVVIFDIGGGSTEFILWRDGGPELNRSLDFGVVRLSEDVLRSDPLSEAELAEARRQIGPLIDDMAAEIRGRLGAARATLVGTAGTASTLGAVDLGLPAYDRERIHGHRLGRDFVRESFERFTALPRARRGAVPGMEPGREDIIVPGCLITLLTLDACQAADMLISEGGLLEGNLYRLLPAAAAGSFSARS